MKLVNIAKELVSFTELGLVDDDGRETIRGKSDRHSLSNAALLPVRPVVSTAACEAIQERKKGLK